MASGVSKPSSSLKVKSSSADDISEFSRSNKRGVNFDLTMDYVVGTDKKDQSDDEVKVEQPVNGEPSEATINPHPFFVPTPNDALRLFLSPEEFENFRLASDDPDLPAVRERLHNMILNIQRFTPWFEDIDLEEMNLEELQSMLWQVRYIEQSFLDPEDFLDFNQFGGLEMLVGDSLNKNSQAFPLGEEVTTQCLVCFEEVKLNKRLCCDFYACDACIKQYIETKVNDEGVVKIGCINNMCDTFIYRDEIIGRLPVNLKDKYYQFLVDANKDPKVKTCPRCSNIYHLTEEDTKDATKYGLIVTCPECKFDWCFECQAPCHSGIKCKEYKKGDRLLTRNVFKKDKRRRFKNKRAQRALGAHLRKRSKEKQYGVNNAQKCPKCKIYIQQRGGCDHMTCSKCKTHFCYKCGERYIDLKFLGNHHSQYSPVGCKFNYQPNRPVLRKFVRGSNFAGRLFGGLLLLGVGAAAIGVLCGASIVIVPAFLGYKYNKHRRLKRCLRRHRELMKNSSNNAELGFHRERIRVENRFMTQAPNDINLVEYVEEREIPEPIHIGIQTGQSQQVDVTVHNPYTPDSLENGESSHTSEIRMNITDEMGQVTLTTAEISHNSNGSDGTEAEIVLHVKTTYQKNAKTNSPKEDPVAPNVTPTEQSQDVLDAGKSSKEIKPTSSNVESTKGSSIMEGRPKSAQVRRRVHSTGSLKKGVKKQEFGSISRKWCLRSTSSKSTSDETDSLFDLSHVQSLLQQSEDKKHLADPDQPNDQEGLTQSGCFITLFGKKLNNLQNHIDKEKIHNSKSDSTTSNADKNSCSELVNRVLVLDGIKDSSEQKTENATDEKVEKIKLKDMVSNESIVTQF